MKSFLSILLLTGVLQAATVGPTDRILPLIQDGDGWSTTVTIVNVASKPAKGIVTFLTALGYNEQWKVELKANAGARIAGEIVNYDLAPGAMLRIETSGTPKELTRGFADVVEYGDQPLGAFATIVKKDADGNVLQRFVVPLSPVHERRSVMALDLTDAAANPELIWVSLTTTTTLDLLFRNTAGEIVLSEQVYLDNKAQFMLNVREYWPEQLQDFQGTMEWTVSYPGADRYEPRFLSGMMLTSREGQQPIVSCGMTLPTDQATVSPHE